MKVRSPFAAGAVGGVVVGLAALQAGAGGLQPQGPEFPLTRGMPGDQVHPSIALTAAGGFLAWQDAAIDGQGLGVAAVRLAEGGGGAVGSAFRVNATVADDQENPSLVSLPNGGAFCVWQGGPQGFQRVFGRVIEPGGSFATGDLAVSTGDGEHQVDPVVVALADGTVVVAWASFRQEGSLAYDAFARRFSARGEPLGAEFRLNASLGLGRRSPALAALPGGGFLAAWISERQVGVRDNVGGRGRPQAGAGAPVFAVTVVARAFDASGVPFGAEQVVSSPGAVAANPVLTGMADGRVLAAWTRRDPQSPSARFDVACRVVDATGVPSGPERLVNSETFGDQYRPRLAVNPHGVLAVWTSLGQDGSWEGVFGRWINASGEPVGDDIQVNSQMGGGQILPALAAARDSGLVVAWSSNLPRSGYEVFAQRLTPLLLKVRPMAAGRLGLQWPAVAGGVYQLEVSRDGRTWNEVGAARAAGGELEEVEVASAGQMVLYRVRRVR